MSPGNHADFCQAHERLAVFIGLLQIEKLLKWYYDKVGVVQIELSNGLNR